MISKTFATAGRAVFTVDNGQGNWYTYKIVYKKPTAKYPNESWLVLVLNGPDNTKDFGYLGKLVVETGEVRLTSGSLYGDDNQRVTVVRWALRLIWNGGQLPPGYKIHHEGRCGRCNHPLTVPESIESGIGPECAGRIARGPVRPKAESHRQAVA